MSARWPSTCISLVSLAIVYRSLWVYFTSATRGRALLDDLGQLVLARFPFGVERGRIALELHDALQDLHALGRLVDALNIHAQGEAVEQLRAQIALFRVHRADQDEARRVGEGDALALDHVDAHGRRVEQQVNHVVVEQVDLIHVQQAAVGRRQHARLEVALALLDGLLDVQRAHDAVLGGADRQVHKAGAPASDRQFLAALDALAAVVALPVRPVRIATKGAVGDHLDFGQQRSQSARRRALGRAALTADQHTADLGADGVQGQGRCHAALADDGSRTEILRAFAISSCDDIKSTLALYIRYVLKGKGRAVVRWFDYWYNIMERRCDHGQRGF